MNRNPGIINDKANQVTWTTRGIPGWRSEFRQYGHTKTIEVEAGRDMTEREIRTVFEQIMRPGKLYYIYVRNADVREKIVRLFREKKIATNSELVLCEKMVDTIREFEEQKGIIQEYHVGKTNHRGVNETVDRLKRQYYWINMTQVVGEILATCEICQLAKYDRRPQRAPQMLTEEMDKPLQTIYADLFYFEGAKYLSIIDGFSRGAYFHRIKSKRATEIIEGLLTYFGVYGIPNKISVDRGKEFDNRKFKNLMKEFNIDTHFTTVGHHRSQSVIERLHNTITEHLHLFKLGKQLTPVEAMPRAMLAYNHSIHSVTKQTPLELMLVDKLTDEQIHKSKDRGRTNKQRRIERVNRGRNVNVQELLKIGTVVYKRNFYKRRKGDVRYVGPYSVVKIMPRNRVVIKRTTDPRGKTAVVHVEELKIPGKKVRRPTRDTE